MAGYELRRAPRPRKRYEDEEYMDNGPSLAHSRRRAKADRPAPQGRKEKIQSFSKPFNPHLPPAAFPTRPLGVPASNPEAPVQSIETDHVKVQFEEAETRNPQPLKDASRPRYRLVRQMPNNQLSDVPSTERLTNKQIAPTRVTARLRGVIFRSVVTQAGAVMRAAKILGVSKDDLCSLVSLETTDDHGNSVKPEPTRDVNALNGKACGSEGDLVVDEDDLVIARAFLKERGLKVELLGEWALINPSNGVSPKEPRTPDQNEKKHLAAPSPVELARNVRVDNRLDSPLAVKSERALQESIQQGSRPATKSSGETPSNEKTLKLAHRGDVNIAHAEAMSILEERNDKRDDDGDVNMTGNDGMKRPVDKPEEQLAEEELEEVDTIIQLTAVPEEQIEAEELKEDDPNAQAVKVCEKRSKAQDSKEPDIVVQPVGVSKKNHRPENLEELNAQQAGVSKEQPKKAALNHAGLDAQQARVSDRQLNTQGSMDFDMVKQPAEISKEQPRAEELEETITEQQTEASKEQSKAAELKETRARTQDNSAKQPRVIQPKKKPNKQQQQPRKTPTSRKRQTKTASMEEEYKGAAARVPATAAGKQSAIQRGNDKEEASDFALPRRCSKRKRKAVVK